MFLSVFLAQTHVQLFVWCFLTLSSPCCYQCQCQHLFSPFPVIVSPPWSLQPSPPTCENLILSAVPLGFFLTCSRLAKCLPYLPYLPLEQGQWELPFCFWMDLNRIQLASPNKNQEYYLIFQKATFDQMLLERYTSPPNLCTSQDDGIFRNHFFLNCMCLHTKRSLKHALPLWLLLILQGVPADAGKYTLSQVSFPPSRVVIICPGCQETGQILLGQEHLLSIPVLLTNDFGDTGQQSTWAQHTSEPRAWEKCQVPVPITSWLCTRAPSSLLEMQTHGPYRSGDLLLPDLPVTDLFLGFMIVPGYLSCHPKHPLFINFLSEIFMSPTATLSSGLGNM